MKVWRVWGIWATHNTLDYFPRQREAGRRFRELQEDNDGPSSIILSWCRVEGPFTAARICELLSGKYNLEVRDTRTWDRPNRDPDQEG